MSEFEKFYASLIFPKWFDKRTIEAIKRYCKTSWEISREQSMDINELLLVVRQKAYNTGNKRLKRRVDWFVELIQEDFDNDLI